MYSDLPDGTTHHYEHRRGSGWQIICGDVDTHLHARRPGYAIDRLIAVDNIGIHRLNRTLSHAHTHSWKAFVPSKCKRDTHNLLHSLA